MGHLYTSFSKVYVQIIYPSYTGIFISLLISFNVSANTQDTRILPNTKVCNICFSVNSLSLYSLNSVCWETKFPDLDIRFTVFSYMDHAFSVFSNKSLPNLWSQNYSLMFYFRRFLALRYPCRFVIHFHFELILYTMWGMNLSSFLSQEYPIILTPFVEKTILQWIFYILAIKCVYLCIVTALLFN